jgi:hypothetical protein
MEKNVVVALESQSRIADPLSEFLREKTGSLLQAAIEAECQELLARFEGVRDPQGRQGVVRNGHLPEREVITGLGPVAVIYFEGHRQSCARVAGPGRILDKLGVSGSLKALFTAAPGWPNMTSRSTPWRNEDGYQQRTRR